MEFSTSLREIPERDVLHYLQDVVVLARDFDEETDEYKITLGNLDAETRVVVILPPEMATAYKLGADFRIDVSIQ